MKAIILLNVRKVFLLILFSSIILRVLAQDENPCELILQGGLYQTLINQNSGNFSQDVKTYFSSEQFKKDFRNKNWSGGISAVINDVPVSLNANADETRINDFQSRVINSTSFRLDQSFYSYALSSIPNVELAKEYTNCVIGNQKFGFKLRPTITENVVVFEVIYTKQFEADLMPRVTFFSAQGATRIRNKYNVGNDIANSKSITCNRNPEVELVFILETNKGSLTFKVPAKPKISGNMPVGTIIASVLPYNTFLQANGLVNDDNMSTAIWIPCDGRELYASKYAQFGTIPDLRGVFLRGINDYGVTYSGVSPVADTQKNPENKQAGDFQADEFKKHSHRLPGARSKGGGGFKGGDNPDYVTNSDVTGGEETRPKNVTVYYYIKIN